MSVPVEVGGEPLPAGEMQPDHTARQRLQTILAAQNVKVRAADPDVLVERSGRNLVGLRGDGEAETPAGLPDVDRLNKSKVAGKGGVTHTAHAFMRERGFNRIRKADGMRPGRRQLFAANGAYTLDVLPNDGGWSLDVNHVFDLPRLQLVENFLLPRPGGK